MLRDLIFVLLTFVPLACESDEGPVHVRVDASAVGMPVSPYLTGACLEDVNHEIYGGLYSQMVFGESFQEPSNARPVERFTAWGGEWSPRDGVLQASGGDGPKLIYDEMPIVRGTVEVEIRLPGDVSGNAGLIVGVNDAGPGADQFVGYEVSLDSQRNVLRVGRHNFDFELIRDVPLPIPHDEWVRLRVDIEGDQLSVSVDGERVFARRDDRLPHAGSFGLRQWRRPAEYRSLRLSRDGGIEAIPLRSAQQPQQVSGIWDVLSTGDASGVARLNREEPFVGNQSQRISCDRGDGEFGVSNRGLNRWGMTFRKDLPYEGYVWARAENPTELVVSARDSEGETRLDEASVQVDGGGDWKRYAFCLRAADSTTDGELALTLRARGSVDLGHVFLQPGGWGRYRGLPVRRDIVEGLLDQGVTALRYGGSMVDNAPNYRWKKMIGPRDRREPYDGHWYDHSTNGWAIVDFLNLCEAAGLFGVPCFSIDETPEDLCDFLEYANGEADSEWGAKRAADGHPASYGLRCLQLGNEESIDEAYWTRFEPIARAIWEGDPALTLVVGDFQYNRPITDPYDVHGADGGVRTLAVHEKILSLAKEYGATVWFDVHVWTGGPEPTPSMEAFFTYVDALDRLAAGADHRVVVFEFNANNHGQRRALANAEMIGRIMRDGRVPVALSANCLQPDGQNDNGWDQGLLFLNSSGVWLQPPGYVTQMISRVQGGRVVPCGIDAGAGPPPGIDVTATRADDASSIDLRVVNRTASARRLVCEAPGWSPRSGRLETVSLASPLEAANTADRPRRVAPRRIEGTHGLPESPVEVRLEPYSFTTIRIQ